MNSLKFRALKKIVGQNLQNLQQLMLCLWAFSVFYPPLNFVFYLFAGVSIIRIFIERGEVVIKFTKEKLPYIFLLVFIVWNLITLFYSEDLYTGLKQVEKKIPLLIISILGLFTCKQSFDFKRTLSIYYYGLISVMTISLIYSAYMLFSDYYLGISLVKGFSHINLLNIFEHRLYIGISILIILPLIFEQMVQEAKTSIKISKLILILISFYLIYSSGSRILMFILLAILFILIFKYLKSSSNKFFPPSFIVITAIVGFSILYFHPRSRLTLDLITKEKPIYKLDDRIVIWQNALEVISDNLFLGTGLGDAKNELFLAYRKNGNYFQLENELNVHNQYLQIILESGLIGIFFFSCFGISLFVTQKDKIKYLITGVIIFGLSFAIESVLSRNLGVFPFSFWLFTLISTEIKPDSSYSKVKKEVMPITNVSAILFSGVLLTMFIFPKFKTIDRTNPNTYMTTPFDYIVYGDLPNRDQLPTVTDACSFYLADHFTNYERGKFLAPELLRAKTDKKISLSYGIWCYISEDANINEAYAYAWNRIDISFYDKYDLNKKGTWQYLSFNDKPFYSDFAAGVRIDLLKQFSSLEGKVYFALPTYELKN